MQKGKLYRYVGPGNNKGGGFDDGEEYIYINDKGEVNYFGNGSGTEKYHYFEEYEEKKTEAKELSAQQIYSKMAALSGLKAGDRVKVLRDFERNEMGFPDSCVPSMRRCIGNEYIVSYVSEEGYVSFNSYRWPFFCLKKLEPLVEIKLNEDYTAIVAGDKKTVTVGCQTFSREKILELAKELN
jgi:hypothetical protein